MATKRSTGPRIGAGPRVATAQPAPSPTVREDAGDRFPVGVRDVDLARVAPDPSQPRRTMDPERLAELTASIAANGLLQPLVVREEGMGRDGEMRYVIIAGGRRYAALKALHDAAETEAERARWARVTVVINGTEGAALRVVQLVENLQREDLAPIEEARALREIVDVEGLTTTALAARIHRSQGYVDERLRLVRHDAIAEAVTVGALTPSAAAAVASVADPGDRARWLARAYRGEFVRAREVYAAKPPRPARPRPPETAARTGLPPLTAADLHLIRDRLAAAPAFANDTEAEAYRDAVRALATAARALLRRMG